MRWPRHELESGRPLLTSPLYARLKARGACFGSKMGWERANWFARAGQVPAMRYTFGRPDWLDSVIAEQTAVREAAGLFDQTSFGKISVRGPGSLALLQRLCANEMDVPAGRVVYTAMLNARGGFESDLTVQRLGEHEFLLVTGTAQPVRDLAWLRRHRRNEDLAIEDVTAQWSVLSLMGPKAEAILGALGVDDLSLDAFPANHFREFAIGAAQVRAVRVAYVGGPGWELYIPAGHAAALFDALHEAGRAHGLANGGYYALDALRIEAGRRAFPAELSPEVTPFEAGLGFAVRIDKATPFIGQDALRALQGERTTGLQSLRLLSFVFPTTSNFAWGGEPIVRNGMPTGELSSVGYSATLEAMVGLGYVRSATPESADELLASRYAIDVSGERVPAMASTRAPWPSKKFPLPKVGEG